MMRPSGTYNVNYENDIAIVRTLWQWGMLIGFLVFLFTVPPLFLSSRWLSFLVITAIVIIAAQGLSILTGYAGQFSLGQAAFMAVGAYTSGILTSVLGFSFWAALPCAGLGAALVGFVFGLPSLRVKGFYLALATLAAHFIIMYIVSHLTITGGTDGMYVPPVTLGGIDFGSDRNYYFLAMGLAVLMVFFAKNLVRTMAGRAFIAIRDNDIAARVMGVNVFQYKLLSFFVCSFYAGVAGSLLAHYWQVVHPEQFTLTDSIWYVGMIVIGGLGSTLGAILGVAFIQLLREVVSIMSPAVNAILPAFMGVEVSAALGGITFGLVLILFLIFEPRGLAHRWQVIKAYYRLWPFAY